MLKGVLKKWNKDIFGNIKVKVEEETKKLEQMQDQFEKGNVTEEFTMHMVDQENQVELLLQQSKHSGSRNQEQNGTMTMTGV
ncbi:hypothetical protein IFM89_003668 [Coptis chinensis]|uniref:Uncharacterized protein n=1 Tax=Coptis chinensis TaxID=261450 RepID=A0A835HI71_9MAGN|nr:hypothetical protein IFM89_003668 [Coptis chinensis]